MLGSYALYKVGITTNWYSHYVRNYRFYNNSAWSAYGNFSLYIIILVCVSCFDIAENCPWYYIDAKIKRIEQYFFFNVGASKSAKILCNMYHGIDIVNIVKIVQQMLQSSQSPNTLLCKSMLFPIIHIRM